jgi:hypothetical protein
MNRIPGVFGTPGGGIHGIRFTCHTGVTPITRFIKKTVMKAGVFSVHPEMALFHNLSVNLRG